MQLRHSWNLVSGTSLQYNCHNSHRLLEPTFPDQAPKGLRSATLATSPDTTARIALLRRSGMYQRALGYHGLVAGLGVLAILPASLLLSGPDENSELMTAACLAEPTWAKQAVCSARHTVEGRGVSSLDIKQYLHCTASYLLPLGTLTAILLCCAVCAAAVFAARRNSTLRSERAGSVIQTRVHQVIALFGLGLVISLLSFPAWNSLEALFCPRNHSNVCSHLHVQPAAQRCPWLWPRPCICAH